MNHLLLTIIFIFFVSCSKESTTKTETPQSVPNKFYELKTPDLSLIDEKGVAVMHLETDNADISSDTGDAGEDEFALEILKSETKEFCVSVESMVELTIEDSNKSILLQLDSGCKSVALQKGVYTIKIKNKTTENHFVHFNKRFDASKLRGAVQRSFTQKKAPSNDPYTNPASTFDINVDRCHFCELAQLDFSGIIFDKDYDRTYSAIVPHVDNDYLKLIDYNGSAYDYFARQNADTLETKYNLDLFGSNLYEANLSYSIFVDANLSYTNLRKADLSHAIFIRTDFSAADLEDANLSYAVFMDCDFSNTVNFNVNHPISTPAAFYPYYLGAGPGTQYPNAPVEIDYNTPHISFLSDPYHLHTYVAFVESGVMDHVDSVTLPKKAISAPKGSAYDLYNDWNVVVLLEDNTLFERSYRTRSFKHYNKNDKKCSNGFFDIDIQIQGYRFYYDIICDYLRYSFSFAGRGDITTAREKKIPIYWDRDVRYYTHDKNDSLISIKYKKPIIDSTKKAVYFDNTKRSYFFFSNDQGTDTFSLASYDVMFEPSISLSANFFTFVTQGSDSQTKLFIMNEQEIPEKIFNGDELGGVQIASSVAAGGRQIPFIAFLGSDNHIYFKKLMPQDSPFFKLNFSSKSISVNKQNRFVNIDINYAYFQNCKAITNIDFSNLQMYKTFFKYNDFDKGKFENATLKSCYFKNSSFRDTSFEGASITDGKFAKNNFTCTDFTNVDFSGSIVSKENNFREADSKCRVDFSYAENIDIAFLIGSDTQEKKFEKLCNKNLQYRHSSFTNLKEVDFDSNVTQCKFVDMDLDGYDIENLALSESDFSYLSLQHGTLKDVKLSSVNLNNSHFDYATLENVQTNPDKHTTFVQSSFDYATIQNCKFLNDDFSFTSFESTIAKGITDFFGDISRNDFGKSTMNDVTIQSSNFSLTNFDDASFLGVSVSDSDFTSVSLHNVKFDDFIYEHEKKASSITYSDLTDADFKNTTFNDVDLTGTKVVLDTNETIVSSDTTCPNGVLAQDNPHCQNN